MKIGIMGGTFDPIHLGHLAMAESAREIFDLDEVLFIPSSKPPHKAEKKIETKAHRLMMTYLAVKSNKNFHVSPMEMLREGFSYTLDTIDELERQYKHAAEFFFIIGSDSMADLPTWHKSKELVNKAHFVAAERPGIEINLEEVKKFFGDEGMEHIHKFITPGLDISSTDIRERIKSGRSIKYLVPEAVEEYILREKLYR